MEHHPVSSALFWVAALDYQAKDGQQIKSSHVNWLISLKMLPRTTIADLLSGRPRFSFSTKVKAVNQVG